MFYHLNQVNNSTYHFTTDTGAQYAVYLSSISSLTHLFDNRPSLNKENFYYLILEKKSSSTSVIKRDNRIVPQGLKYSDIYIMRTVASCLFQFFTDNREAVVLFNYDNRDNKILGRRRIFKEWFDEYSKDSLYKFYQKDFLDVASICALYTRYSSHPDFADIEGQIKELIDGYSDVFEIPKTNQ